MPIKAGCEFFSEFFEHLRFLLAPTYCWLLDEGNGRISSDRLSRFIGPKRKRAPEPNKLDKKKIIRRKKQTEDSSSEEQTEIITYNDSLDDSPDIEDFSSEEDCQVATENLNLILEKEKYYTVLYEEVWYLGRILKERKQGVFTMKFLKQEDNSFIWPKNSDIARVEKQ